MPDTAPPPDLTVRGVAVYKGWLAPAAQAAMVDDLRAAVAAAPLFQPETRFGRKMSVRMTSAGRYGWVSDRRGYRYDARHPSGVAWPPIPASVLAVWDAITGLDRRPDCCLINYYAEGARMGMHQDRDEADFQWPVLSISLGDDALFRIGNLERGGKTESLWLTSGDVLVMGGAARLVHHGIDRLRPGSSGLLTQGGRLNLTLRVVD
ncbi:alpha-ketoglutarate-dependent dioxygenase AlkB family protein [Rhodovulum adriaticum]|uniref:Alkylated DNA repair protein (DNA oxidative demethylase) n=1 Tax=Rhodovulum adriaticum TaxID=35804 RepID=A0A4R2NYI8_RHOAD|nr:alpha-ketoglutarate-dependent dioxygenase AlkB [Rhodovulum adriaticum]MBK1636843.1 alkylated DNA repair dioxygenase [Rhodovulum adriaticum]TCP27349.1 alkylated DNA repair protein (DNA oxidative demethylase) [Rhodovulum adriaticum]